MPQTYPEDGDFSCKPVHHLFTDTGFRRFSGPRRKNNQLRLQQFNGIDCHFIIPNHLDIRVYRTDELVQIIGKAVIIVY